LLGYLLWGISESHIECRDDRGIFFWVVVWVASGCVEISGEAAITFKSGLIGCGKRLITVFRFNRAQFFIKVL